MTHYLRDGHATLVDIDATPEDLCCVVVLDAYSHFLLSIVSESRRQKVIADFYAISEIRGLYFESEIASGITPDELAKRELMRLAKEYGLQYVTD